MSTKDDAWALITNALGAAGTAATVTTGHGARFPANNIGYYARIYNLADPGINERVYNSGRSTDSLNALVRNVDSRGAQTVTASGWAIEVVHDIEAVEGGPHGVFVNQANTAAPFSMYVPTEPIRAKLMQAGDALTHKQTYQLINATAGAHTFTLSFGFGLNGVAQQVFHTVTVSVPASTTYIVDLDVLLFVLGTANQYIRSRAIITNATTGAHVDTKQIIISSGTFDTNANNSGFLHTGLMDAASASLTVQGFPSVTQLVRNT